MMASLTQEEIKVLEQTRQRLSQLTNSLASLQQNILQSDPLPPWSSLQSLAYIISQNLNTVSNHLTSNDALLSSLAVFPLPIYPGKTQEALLTQLLRKKLEPAVEDWVIEGQEVMQEGHISQPEDRNEVLELWKWAGVAANELARGHEWGGEFTKEERESGVENVVTGLERGLEEDYENDSEEDEEAPDGDEMGIIGAKRKDGGGTEFQVRKVVGISASGEASDALPLENILKFMITGAEQPK